MNSVFVVMPGLLVLVLLMAFVSARARKAPLEPKYRRRELMTENEMEFFGRLVAALPEHYIFTQVAMTALLDPASSDGKRAHGDRLRIAQQRIDYVVCNRRCEVVAVIELDDKTHSTVKDQLRDGRLAQGGFRTVRFQSRQKPSPAAIRAAILPPVAPSPSPVDAPFALG